MWRWVSSIAMILACASPSFFAEAASADDHLPGTKARLTSRSASRPMSTRATRIPTSGQARTWQGRPDGSIGPRRLRAGTGRALRAIHPDATGRHRGNSRDIETAVRKRRSPEGRLPRQPVPPSGHRAAAKDYTRANKNIDSVGKGAAVVSVSAAGTACGVICAAGIAGALGAGLD